MGCLSTCRSCVCVCVCVYVCVCLYLEHNTTRQHTTTNSNAQQHTTTHNNDSRRQHTTTHDNTRQLTTTSTPQSDLQHNTAHFCSRFHHCSLRACQYQYVLVCSVGGWVAVDVLPVPWWLLRCFGSVLWSMRGLWPGRSGTAWM